MSDDEQKLQNLYDLLRALVFKLGGNVTLTKAEIMLSMGVSMTIQHVPQKEVSLLRIWCRHEEEQLAWLEAMLKEKISDESKKYYLERAQELRTRLKRAAPVAAHSSVG